MFQEFALGVHGKAVLAHGLLLPSDPNPKHQSYTALQELARQDRDVSKDQIQVCPCPWIRPPASPPPSMLPFTSRVVFSILVSFLWCHSLSHPRQGLNLLLSPSPLQPSQLRPGTRAALQKELLITSVLEELVGGE